MAKYKVSFIVDLDNESNPSWIGDSVLEQLQTGEEAYNFVYEEVTDSE